jgi:EAL domain-containing protein (putative c-di-GMP-specific phosphodiesterase class I)
MRIAVNLAGADVVDPELPDAVADRLRHHGLPATCLEVEITESTVIGDPASALGVLSRLREMGIRVALDDFGTGQSSLAYLKRLPIDGLKIDRSFVMGMSDDESDAVIVRSTIDLARNLGLDVVAEGVESAEAWNDLATLGCDTAQGFFMSRALPAAELERWLADRPWPADEPTVRLLPEEVREPG